MTTLETVLNVTIPFCFKTLYLGLRPDSLIDREYILLIASKKALARKWLPSDAPTVEDWAFI